MNTTSTVRKRRDQVKPGDVVHSSHGYRLLVTEVLDTAKVRTDDRHVEIRGHLHADPTNVIRNERYPAGSLIEVESLTWNEAVDAAMEPTELDLKLGGKRGAFGTGESIIGEDGKINDFKVVRERAAYKYATAHAGEQVEVTFVNPDAADERSRLVFRAHGELKSEYVTYPVFVDYVSRNEQGLLVGSHVIPVAGVSSIRTEYDKSVVVL